MVLPGGSGTNANALLLDPRRIGGHRNDYSQMGARFFPGVDRRRPAGLYGYLHRIGRYRTNPFLYFPVHLPGAACPGTHDLPSLTIAPVQTSGMNASICSAVPVNSNIDERDP
jgi:hypothetical protein